MSFDSNEDFFAGQAFEEGVRQGRGYGAAEERARLVAWLRSRAAYLTLGAENDGEEWAMITALKDAARLIEAKASANDA